MESDPKIFLNEARKSVKDGDFDLALEKYEYFFDHALDNDPASYYGVRLSYCLDEWAELGSKYPKARERLEWKRDESLRLLFSERLAEHFHDFISICDYLKCPHRPTEEFIKIHESDVDLAEEIVRFIWDSLVRDEHWEICSFYMKDPKEKYSEFLMKFDQAMNICKSDESLGGERFENQIKDWCITDITNMLLVLKHSGQSKIFQEITDLAKVDLASRSYSEIYNDIARNVAL